MALVLAASGWFLYAAALVAPARRARAGAPGARAGPARARPRIRGLARVADDGARLVEHGESYAQLVDGGPRRGGDAAARRQSGAERTSELRAAAGGPIVRRTVSSVPGLNEPSRVLATPGPAQRAATRARRRRDDARTSRRRWPSFRNELLIAGPIALILAIARRLPPRRTRAAAGRADAPAGGRDLGRDTGRAAAGAETRDEVRTARRDAERDARAPRGRALSASGTSSPTPATSSARRSRSLRTELELALRHAESPDELREAVRRSAEEVDRLTQLADDLLLIARSERGKLPLRLETLPADGAARLGRAPLRVARGGGAVGRVHGSGSPACRVRGDRLRLEQALGNLVDNALRHGGGRVRLEAVRSNGVVELHVTDEGSGFPPEFLADAFERFTRPDAARDRRRRRARARDRPDDRRRPRRRHARRQP